MSSLLSRVMLSTGTAAAVMLGSVAAAGAQPPEKQPEPSLAQKRAAAKKFVAAAIAAQETQDFDTAITLYQKAFLLVPHPILMFNVGQAHRLAGRPELAARFYSRYLELEPDGTESATARAHLASIKAAALGAQPAPGAATATPVHDRFQAPALGDDDEPPEKVAAADRGEEGDRAESGIQTGPAEAPVLYSPGERAFEATAGLSFTARRLTFGYDASKVSRPGDYTQSIPAPGVYLDAMVFPAAVGHERRGIIRHLGATVMLDHVIGLSSRSSLDGQVNDVTERRYALGIIVRYPLGSGARAPVVGATLRYGRQQFTVDGTSAIPDVRYSLIDVAGFVRYMPGQRTVLNFKAGLVQPTSAGEITMPEQYGAASFLGFELGVGMDYLLTAKIFVRGEARLETLGYSFDTGDTTGVESARDTYWGGALTAGYLF
jgi:hypothetical protein